MRRIALVAGLALLLGACTMEIRPTATPLNFVPEKMEMVGKVYGEVTWTKFLFLFGQEGDMEYSTRQAIAVALLRSPGHPDAILNPAVDVVTETFAGGFWEQQTLRVTGEGVRFKRQAEDAAATPVNIPAVNEELLKLMAKPAKGKP